MPRKTKARALVRDEHRGASMRPRPDAAENRLRVAPGARGRGGFNEAAARCRGKPDDTATDFDRAARLQ